MLASGVVMRLKLTFSRLGTPWQTNVTMYLYIPTNVRAPDNYFGAELRLWNLGLSLSACCPSFGCRGVLAPVLPLAWDTMHNQFERPEAQLVTGNRATKQICVLTTPVLTHPACLPIEILPLDLSISAPRFHMSPSCYWLCPKQ